MRRLRITLATDLKEAPSEIRIFRAGINKTTKGDFLFDAKAAKAVTKAFEEYGNRLCFDYAHSAVPEKGARPQDQKAAGWFDLEVKDGELWAVNIEWTDTAKTEIEAKEWMYISPWFIFDEKTGRVLEILNIALTNTPATKEAAPLIAADRGTAADNRTEYLAGFRATQRALEEALKARYPQPNDWELWVAEVYDDQVIFNDACKLWQQGYQLQGLTALLLGDRVQVEVTYTPVQVSVSRDAPPVGAMLDRRTAALASFGDIINAVRDALTKRYPQPNGWDLYPDAVYDDVVVFRRDGRCWQQPYHLDGTVAILDGDAIEVEISYVPVVQSGTTPAGRNISSSQPHGAVASQERASAQKESLMDKAFLAALDLSETAPDTEALAKLTRLTADMAELCKLTGKNNPSEALGTVTGWKAHAEQLPAAQKQVADLQAAARKAEVAAILDGAPTKVTPAMKPSLLSARPFDKDDDVAWLKAHVEALPTVAALDPAGKPKMPATTTSDPNATSAALAGKKWEEIPFAKRAELKKSDPATYEALRAEHQARKTA